MAAANRSSNSWRNAFRTDSLSVSTSICRAVRNDETSGGRQICFERIEHERNQYIVMPCYSRDELASVGRRPDCVGDKYNKEVVRRDARSPPENFVEHPRIGFRWRIDSQCTVLIRDRSQ